MHVLFSQVFSRGHLFEGTVLCLCLFPSDFSGPPMVLPGEGRAAGRLLLLFSAKTAMLIQRRLHIVRGAVTRT
jgi:hypothetical protein